MFRTRDLVLFFTIVLFLVVAIGVTTVNKYGSKSSPVEIPAAVPEITQVVATTSGIKSESLTREQRLEAMRQKIEDSELVITSDPPTDEDDTDAFPIAVSTDKLSAPLKCTNYTDSLVVNWPVRGVTTDFIEGVRQYYVETPVSIDSTSTSTLTNKQVILSLPTHFVPFGGQTCLSDDIIGVALDGSLIRNSDASLYKLFGNETLVGYALDGFPIYGTGTNETDDCGGRIELGQYRYEISSDRQNMINCFVGTPQTISP